MNGYFHIEVGQVGCFSHDQITAEIKFGESEKAMVTINRQELAQTRFLETRVVHDLLRRIFGAAQTPEVLSGGRMTTWHYANLVWKNLYLDNYDLSGELKFKGSELPEEILQEASRDRGPRGEELRSLLEKGLHCRALKIYDIVNEFAESIAYLQRDYE